MSETSDKLSVKLRELIGVEDQEPTVHIAMNDFGVHFTAYDRQVGKAIDEYGNEVDCFDGVQIVATVSTQGPSAMKDGMELLLLYVEDRIANGNPHPLFNSDKPVASPE